MNGQGHNQRSMPRLRQIISTTLDRARLQAFGSRERRDQPTHDEYIETMMARLAPRRQTVTCIHLAHSWFSQPIQPGDEPGDGRDKNAEDHARATITLRGLLAESVIFATISAFYPPNPTPSGARQSAIHHQLLAALESAMRQYESSGSSLSNRAPQIRPAPERCFTLFPSLPAEIRLHIWQAALLRQGYRTLQIGQPIGDPYCWTARLPMPALAWVCRESREVIRQMVFPIYADSPYEGGPGSSGDATTRFVASWASDDDCLDFGDDANPTTLKCGDYVERLQDFSAVAHSLTNILIPSPRINLHGNRSRNTSGRIKKLMVVIQVVHIALPSLPPGELSDRAMQSHRDDLPVLPPEDRIRVCTVDDIAGGTPLDRCVYRASVHQRRTVKVHHITTIASLRDRERIEEVLALGTVTRYWTDRQSRLRALRHLSNAFCMDCLLEWWDKYALGAAREALLMGEQRAASLAGVSYSGVSPGEEPDAFPELVPAVRFKIEWPGFEDVN